MSEVRTVVYVSNAESREIYLLELNEQHGSLKIGERIGLSGVVKPLAINPAHDRLYVAITSEPYSVTTFEIDAISGKLRRLSTTPLPDRMAYISTDRSGRFLFGASYYGHKISVSRIGPAGDVQEPPLEVIPTGKNPHCILTDLSNRFLFVSNLGADAIQQFHFNEISGAIAPNVPSAVSTRSGAGPRHFVFHHNRRFVFGTNELDGTVNTYRLEPHGTLTLIESTSTLPVDFRGRPWAADIHLTPDGNFLYSSERSSSTIAAFSINAENGVLTRIANYETETQPRGFNIDPKGRYLLAVGEKSNRLSVYEIDQLNGTLNKVSQINVGEDPTWVEIITLGK